VTRSTWATYNAASLPPGLPRQLVDNRNTRAERDDPRTDVFYKRSTSACVTTTTPAVRLGRVQYSGRLRHQLQRPVQAGTVTRRFPRGRASAPNSFIINSTTQVTYHYRLRPFAAQGLHTMTMAAGAVLRSPDGQPALGVHRHLRYDAVLLQVTSTNPPFPNGVMTLRRGSPTT